MKVPPREEPPSTPLEEHTYTQWRLVLLGIMGNAPHQKIDQNKQTARLSYNDEKI